MVQTKTCKAFVGLCMTAIAGCSWMGASFSALANTPDSYVSIKPRVGGKGGPGGRTPGGSRPPDCLGQNYLESLAPGDGITTDKNPAFLVHVPSTGAKQGKLSLRDEQNQLIYEGYFPLNSNAINSFRPPDGAFAGLEVGKRYAWVFSVICDAESPDANPYYEGWITRTELNSALADRLAKAPITNRIALYKSAGLWYDAMITIAELRRTQPDDIALKNAWMDLLNYVGLNEMVSAPLF